MSDPPEKDVFDAFQLAAAEAYWRLERKMTATEFKAWFEGFSEGMKGVPTKAQWARIQERVGEITAEPVRWWPSWYWSTTSNVELAPLTTNISWVSSNATPDSTTLDAIGHAANIGKIEFERVQ